MQQSPINNVQPEQELNNEQMPIDTTSSPTIAKPIVGSSAFASDPLQQVLLCLNNLSINDAREVIRKASVTLTQFANSKTEDIVFVN